MEPAAIRQAVLATGQCYVFSNTFYLTRAAQMHMIGALHDIVIYIA